MRSHGTQGPHVHACPSEKDVFATSITQTRHVPEIIVIAYSLSRVQLWHRGESTSTGSGRSETTNLLENLPEGSIILMFSSGLTEFQGVGLLFVQTTFIPTTVRSRREGEVELTRRALRETCQVPASTTDSQTDDCITTLTLALNWVRNRDEHTVVWPVEMNKLEDSETRRQETKLYLDGVPVSHELPCTFAGHDGWLMLVLFKMLLVELSRSFTCRNPPIRQRTNGSTDNNHRHGFIYKVMGMKVSWFFYLFQNMMV